MHLLIDDRVDNENLYSMEEYYELIQQLILDSIKYKKFKMKINSKEKKQTGCNAFRYDERQST